MAELGLGAYRFSVAWPRVSPTGRGPGQRGGPRLLPPARRRAARARHRPRRHPLPLGPPAGAEDAGGWPSRDDRRALRRVRRRRRASALGDRVGRWTTLNEPWCSAFLGYGAGVHAPGRTDAGRRAARRPPPQPRARPRRVARCGRPRRRAQVCDHAQPRAVVRPATDAAADVDAARRIDGSAEPGLPRPDAATAATPTTCVADTAASPTGRSSSDGDLATIAAPHRRARRQLLQPAASSRTRPDGRRETADGHGARRRPVAGCDDVEFPRRRPAHGDGLAHRPDAACTSCCCACDRDYPDSRSWSPRTAPPPTTRSGADGRVARPRADRLPARPPRRRARRDRRRRRRARLLRVVAAGQLRVGLRLREALRHRPRRLRDAGAHAEGLGGPSTGAARSGTACRPTARAGPYASPRPWPTGYAAPTTPPTQSIVMPSGPAIGRRLASGETST